MFLLPFSVQMLQEMHKKTSKLFSYLKEHGKRNAFFVKNGVFVDERDTVLVQLTSSFAVFLGSLEVCGSAPLGFHTYMAARWQTGRVKTFNNMTLKSLIFLHREVSWRRKRGVSFGDENLKEDKRQKVSNFHLLQESTDNARFNQFFYGC